jgi:class 3 adenylate cyclase/tetratricopeptide (TPR) repeat protein
MTDTCAVCGSPLPAEARFCPRCGAPVDGPPGEERKLVTVLFADLTASTELAARLDPERFRELQSAVYSAADAEVASLRGRIEKFVGDAVMAVFGIPRAGEDDAVRAVRAALSIQDRVVRVGAEHGLEAPLRMRIGLNSGPVATGRTAGDQQLVSGVAVNMAARLQQAAEPGEILAGETTRLLALDAVRFGEPRTVSARGLDAPVSAYPVEALSPRSSRRTIPLVGRRRELSLLEETFRRTEETSRAHLVTLVGEPGIGKSRLVEELLASLPEHAKVLFGRAGEFGEDVTFAPVAEMLQRELEVGPDTDPDEVDGRLRDLVAGRCDPSDVERTAARLGMALGLGEEAPGDHPYRLGEIRSGLEALVAGMTRESPVVMVFEDLQLAREELLDLIGPLLRRTRRLPLLVICVAREELLELRPEWGAGIPDSMLLHLEPLTEEEAVDLARAAGTELEEQTAARVARLAGGNPFFIVETTGMLQAPVPGDAPARWVIPPTVQAAAASRIDHLPDDARDLVRTASVFPGASFEEWEVGLLTEPDPDVLTRLEDAELLVRDPGRPERWRFRHEVLRDVAYESLTKRDRMRLHSRVAEGLAAHGDHHVRSVAYHLERAALAAADLGADGADLTDRAIEALTQAGHVARRRIESRAAVDLYRRALALAGPEEGWRAREARVLAGRGEAHYWLGEFGRAERVLTRALEVGDDDPWTVTMASRFLGDIVLNMQADPDRAEELFGRALEAADALGDPWATARTLLMAGWAPYWRGEHDEAGKMFERALHEARSNPKRDAWAEARALVSLASVNSPGGYESESLELAQEALAIGEEVDDPFTVAVARESVGNSLRRMWRLDEALPHLESAVATFRELGARWELAAAVGDRGHVHRLAGRAEEAEADLRTALDLCLELEERALIAWTASELARVLLQLGRVEEAGDVLRDAGGRDTEPSAETAVLQTHAMVALAEGDRERALDLARQAVAAEEEPGIANYLAAVRWWAGRLFGPEAAGGVEAMEQARRTLEDHGWLHALYEPDLAATPRG